MRTRLIDEDVLAGESVKILKWLMERQEQGIGTTLGELHEKWIDAVRKAPTAYDLDKVVTALDKASDYYEFNEQGMERVQMLKLVDAIEIVKGGGIDDN